MPSERAQQLKCCLAGEAGTRIAEVEVDGAEEVAAAGEGAVGVGGAAMALVALVLPLPQK